MTLSMIEEFMAAVGVPRRYWASDWEGFVDTSQYAEDVPSAEDVVRQLKRFAGWRGEGGESMVTLISVKPGRGKTMIAAMQINRWLRTRGGVGCVFLDWQRILVQIAVDRFGPQPWLEEVRRTPFVVLDDISATSEIEKEMLGAVINVRYNSAQPTIITSNLTLEQVGDQIDARSASRMMEGIVIDMSPLPDARRLVAEGKIKEGSDG